MSSSIARALLLVVAVSPLAVLAISACGSDRPPAGNTSFTTGETDGSTEGGSGGIGVTVTNPGGYCREVDGAAIFVPNPELTCMCEPANVGEYTVTLPCGFAFCDEAAQETAVCAPDQVVSFHSECPSTTEPQDWIPSCAVDAGPEAGSEGGSDAGSDAPSDSGSAH